MDKQPIMTNPGETKSEPITTSNEVGSTLLQWPPQRLKSGASRRLEIFLNVLSIFLVSLLIIYIGFLFYYNGRDNASLPSMWEYVNEFSRLGPTVVPLIFAFTAGRTIRSYAHWRLQHGERIGFLDSLFGSTTMTNTVTTMIDARRVRVSSIVLVILWSLSPLGGQATLRVLLHPPEDIPSTTTLPYLDTNISFPDRYITGNYGGLQIPVNSLFYGSLGASDQVKHSSMDPWSNIKIPMIESLPQYTGLDSKEWISLDQTQNSIVYSGLLGIPIANVSRANRSNFTLETSYLNLECADLQNLDSSTGARQAFESHKDGCFAASRPGINGCSNTTFTWGGIMTAPYMYPQDITNATWQRNTRRPLTARRIYYYSYDHPTNYTFATCTMATSYVEIRVECSSWDCASTAIRPSTLAANPSTNFTFFDNHPSLTVPSMFFFQIFRTITDGSTGGVGSPSLIQSYLYDPELGLNASAVYSLPPVYTIGKQLFSIRLSQLINTYWLALTGAEPMYLGHPEDYSSLSTTLGHNYTFSHAESTVYTRVTILRYNRAWMGVLIASVILLLFAAAVGLFLDLRVWAPKLLMNVSTLTRGNPNFGVPLGGGALPDETRAKILADVRVRFGDAEFKDGHHDLVVGDCVEQGGRVSKLTKGKLYS